MAKAKSFEGTALAPHLLNNAQRKALAEIVEKRLGTKVSLAREKEQELEKEIIWKLVKRFKVDAIQSQISKLKKDMESLEQMRDALGFGWNEYGDEFHIAGGEAKKLLEGEVKERSVSIRRLEDTRDALKQGIWLAESVEEARQVIQQVEGL